MKKFLIVLAFVMIAGGFTIGYYMYNKPHVNVSKKKIDLITTVDSLVHDFQSDYTTSIEKYGGKIILLSGKFHSMSYQENYFTTIIIKGDQSLANCEMDTSYTNKIPSFTAEDEISVKGLFVGYDDLLGELQLKKCLIVKK